jgi:thiol-disulfide isomerase/thioredoxin
MTIFWISYAVLWVVVAVQGFAFLEAIRHIGLLRERLGPYQGAGIVPSKIDMGSPLPELTALTAAGDEAAWADYLHAPLGLVLFLSPHCVTCRDVAEGLPALAGELDGEASVVTIIEGPAEEVRAFVRETELPPRLVAIDEAGATSKRLGMQWTPAALSIRGGDTLGTAAVVNDIYQVDSFVSEELAKTKDDLARSTTSSSRGVPR